MSSRISRSPCTGRRGTVNKEYLLYPVHISLRADTIGLTIPIAADSFQYSLDVAAVIFVFGRFGLDSNIASDQLVMLRQWY